MKIKELREILVHYQGKEYDNWDLKLWDYNNQREINWMAGTYSSSKSSKSISFPVSVEPVDGEEVNKRMKRLLSELNGKLNYETDLSKNSVEAIKDILSNLKNSLSEIQKKFDGQCNELLEKIENDKRNAITNIGDSIL